MSETLSVFATGNIVDRINSLASQVDLDCDGEIDDKEAGLFYKAALNVEDLTDDDRQKIASFASKQMVSKNKKIPLSELTACLSSIFSNKNDNGGALSELERSFDKLSVDLPPLNLKVNDEQIESRITKFVKKIDIDDNGEIDYDEMFMFLTGFHQVISSAIEDGASNMDFFDTTFDVTQASKDLTINGGIKMDDVFPSLLKLLGKSRENITSSVLKVFEDAVQAGIQEFKKPSTDKIRNRVNKLVEQVVDTDGDGMLSPQEIEHFLKEFTSYMNSRGVVEDIDPKEDAQYICKGREKIPFDAITNMIMDQIPYYGEDYLCELQEAILSATKK